MNYLAKILVFPREGVLDTQGKAVGKALGRIGFSSVKDVKIGKYIQVNLEAKDEKEAETAAEEMCRELLVNDLVEDHSIRIERIVL
jgi:phosphoribosylformylglycinamidine synthase PurS subunit